MMNIYDINREIETVWNGAIDPETGEIDPEAMETLKALNIERDEKIENVALWHKNTTAEVKAIAEEIKNLQERKKRLESKAEWQKQYLDEALRGDRFETAKVAVSYRKSESVVIDDEDAFTSKYAGDENLVDTTVKYTPNKTRIKKALKDGEVLEGAHIQVNNNIQIR